MELLVDSIQLQFMFVDTEQTKNLSNNHICDQNKQLSEARAFPARIK